MIASRAGMKVTILVLGAVILLGLLGFGSTQAPAQSPAPRPSTGAATPRPTTPVEPRQSSLPAKPEITITAKPGTLVVDPSEDSSTIPLAIEMAVPTTALADGIPEISLLESALAAPGALEAKIAKIGNPVLERGADGTPTGTITQPIELKLEKVPRRLAQTSLRFRVDVGKATSILEIKVSNAVDLTAGATLNLDVQPKFLFVKQEGIRLTLSTRKTDAPQVSITAGPFSNSENNEVIPYSICLPDEAVCALPGATIDLAENQQAQIVLRPEAGGPDWLAVTPGEYTGEIRVLASNGLSASKTVTLVMTSWLRQWAGLFLLALGVWLSYIFTISIPYKIDRNQRLLPFVAIKEDLEQVSIVAEAAAEKFEGSQRHLLGRILEVQATIHIDRLVDRRLVAASRFWPPIAPLETAAMVKAFADEVAKKVRALRMIAEAQEQASKSELFNKLDKVADDDDYATDTAKKIEAARAYTERPEARQPTRQTDATLPTRTQIYVTEQGFSKLTAYWVGFLVILSGVLLVILPKSTFGTTVDLITAFAWGLGLSATGNGVLARKMPASLSYPSGKVTN